MNNPKIAVFYHLATMGHYKQVDAEILGLIKHSGLLQAASEVNIGIVGEEEPDLLYEHKKFNIERLDPRVDRFEYPTMD